MPRQAAEHLLEEQRKDGQKEIGDQEVDRALRVVGGSLLKQCDQRQEHDNWARVSNLALNVPAIRFVGAHARGRSSYAASLAACRTSSARLGRAVFQIATGRCTKTGNGNQQSNVPQTLRTGRRLLNWLASRHGKR